ncbi:MAG: S8 family serine peptidase [Flavobacteriales bacterium]|nr:S8 family serine peptidase [Flavobacteriales bacterium]
MKRFILLFSWVILGVSDIASQTVDTNFVDAIIYVRTTQSSGLDLASYASGNVALDAVISQFSVDSMIQPFPGLNGDLDRTFRIYFSDTLGIDNLIQAFSLLPEVEYAEKAPLYKTTYVPNDDHPNLWYLSTVKAYDAWDVHQGQGSVVVAVVDNAIRTTHEDLANVLYENPGEIPGNGFDDDLNGYVDDVSGWDAADNDNDPNPPSGINSSNGFNHGTHCAGTAVAETDNGLGVASVAFNAKLLPVKCTPNSNPDGNSLPNAYDGVFYAIRAGADIISMSFGGASGIFVTGQSIIQASNAAGIVMIAAAGNDNSSQAFYPASYPGVISVGATNDQDQKAGFSNYGSNIDVMAPGASIYSCFGHNDQGYGYMWGTSMACPMVASLAALLLDKNSSLSPTQLENEIKASCDNIDAQNSSYVGQMGAGRVNAATALWNLTGISTNGYAYDRDIHFKRLGNKSFQTDAESINLYDLLGKEVDFKKSNQTFEINSNFRGICILKLSQNQIYKLYIQ